LQDSGGHGRALLCLGNNALLEGNVAGAEREYAQALILLRASSDDWGASIVLNNLGNIAGQAGRYADAERYLSESLELGLRIGDPWRKGMALGSLGELYVGRDMPGRAAEVMVQCLALERDARNIFSLPFELQTCSRLAVALTQSECALRLAGAVDGIRRRFASPSQHEPDFQKAVDEAHRTLEPDVATAARQQGLAMTTDEAIEYALGWLRELTASTTTSLERAVILGPVL
jgi:tetratricopeptide (TPR) repeat protein